MIEFARQILCVMHQSMWDSIVVYGGRYVSNQESILEIPQSELKGTQRLNYLPPLVSWQLASDWIPRNVFTLNLKARYQLWSVQLVEQPCYIKTHPELPSTGGNCESGQTALYTLRDLPSSFSKCWKQNSLAIPRNWCLEWHICMYMCI